ncbi:zinc ribbon domain-containing protein [Mycobacterium sp. URHB0044]|uniref:FmdB family zinc ribbon protein n=1 Tax=Mycobacterium sp. URHB0044 TaxID=1380386 RepID=UPI0009DCA62D|nr:zinc ribbon domain-containing protein [Mycobacterium sp. URHB0044]
MPTYGYECAPCGGFDLVRPMAQAGDPAACPSCGHGARRVFGLPALRSLDPSLRRAMDSSARSADAPSVVSTVPGRSRRATRTTTDPRHARLPRP